jgi:SAM-dependent methyltransferase
VRLKRAPNNQTYLHIWREDELYDERMFRLLFRHWNNLKVGVLPYPSDDNVQFHDIRRPLPLASETFDVVYANGILEHLTPARATSFAQELARVLKPGGLARVVVPDLEESTRRYLAALEACLSNASEANVRSYRWEVIALLDQLVRTKPGGLMLEALEQGAFESEEIRTRREGILRQWKLLVKPGRYLAYRLGSAGLGSERSPAWRSIRPSDLTCGLRRWAVRLAGQNDPRKTFEAHPWMHDRVSLQLLLEGCGFVEYSVKEFDESAIPGWQEDDLDRASHEYPLEPFVYVECRKAAREG